MADVNCDQVVSKVGKYVEQLKAKNQKLQEENVRLKKQQAEMRSANSRIKRIPRGQAAPAPAAEEAAS